VSRAIWSAAFLVAFLLGGVAITVGIAYFSWWASDPSAPLRHEALIGAGMAPMYGLLPGGVAFALAKWKRSELPKWADPASRILVAVIVIALAISIFVSARDT